VTTTWATHIFSSRGGVAAGVASWIHLRDLPMTRADEQNDRVLRAMVDEINAAFADSVSFVYLPGDVAEYGCSAAYAVARQSLDWLQAPWCAVISRSRGA
jgi:Icc protein